MAAVLTSVLSPRGDHSGDMQAIVDTTSSVFDFHFLMAGPNIVRSGELTRWLRHEAAAHSY